LYIQYAKKRPKEREGKGGKGRVGGVEERESPFYLVAYSKQKLDHRSEYKTLRVYNM
jgi:hypothetical protein